MRPNLKRDTFFTPVPGGSYLRTKRGLFKIKRSADQSLSGQAEQQKKHGRKIAPRTLKCVAQALYPYRSEVTTVIATTLVMTLLGLVPPLLVGYVFDDAIGKGDSTLLIIYVAFIAAALIFSGLIGVGQAYLSNKVGQNVMHDIQNQLKQHWQNMPMNSSTGTPTREIPSCLSNEASGIPSM